MQYINIHTHSFSNNPAILEIVNQYPWEFSDAIPNYSVGIHPWYINEVKQEENRTIICAKLQEKNCLALGECGLDKRIETPLALQIKVFQEQLQLVQNTNKPIILHCVAAFDELIAIKKEMQIENPMLIHGFSKNKQVAKQLLDQGFYLSFGKYLLRNPELAAVFEYVPNTHFFLETDTIEENIVAVYEKATKAKKIEIETLKKIIQNNFKTIFEQ